MKLQDDREKRCESCRFFYYVGDECTDHNQFGTCVRFPPQRIGLQPGEHPQNEPYQWGQPAVIPWLTTCGEWAPFGDVSK